MAIVHSLKFKITATLIVTMSVLLAYQTLFVAPQIREKQIADSIQMQSTLSDQIANELDHSFLQAINELEAIAKLPGITSQVKTANDQTILTMDKVTHFFNYFFLMDSDGNWLSFPKRSHMVGTSIPAKNLGWVNKTFDGKGTVFLDVILANINKLVSGFSTPVPSASDEPNKLLRGVFVVSEENTLLSTLKKIKVGTNGYAFLVSSNGWVLAHPNIQQSPDKFTVYDYSKFAPVKAVIEGRSGHLEYEYKNQNWLASFRPIPSTGWGIIVQQPADEIYAPIENNMALLNRFFVISFALCIIIMVTSIRYFLSPLTKLETSISSGEILQSVPKYAKDEVGQLATMFSELFNRLQHSLTAQEKSAAELWKYKDHLEEIVEERSSELKVESKDREQAEKALLASEERLSLIISQSPLAIISLDVNFNVISWNRAAEKIFGYSAEFAIGKHADFIIPSPEREHVDKIWKKLLKMSGGGRSTNENVTSEGQTILCDWYNTPLVDSSNKIIGVLCICDDITQKDRMEKDLLKIKKFESLGILAGGIAHDFNNILTGILGNINLALFDKGIKDKTRQRLMRAEKASHRATALTKQLLTFSKGDAPTRETTDLAKIIKDSAKFSLLGDTVACRFNIPENLWLADIDKDQISRVVQNIVINASHSMPDGGTIHISCENFHPPGDQNLALSADKKFIKITLKDSGIGMPTDVLDKIFDPYFTTKQEGSGLGLAVSHSIITKHNGQITVESKPGHGTTFTIYVPASFKEISPGKSDKHASTKSARTVTVMVMDDDDTIKDVAIAMLTEMGHETVLASDGTEAIKLFDEKAKSNRPVDIIIMDLTIPGGMGGKEAVQKILGIDPKAKVILSTGYANDSAISSCEEHGFCGAISKPYTLEDLAQIIDETMDLLSSLDD